MCRSKVLAARCRRIEISRSVLVKIGLGIPVRLNSSTWTMNIYQLLNWKKKCTLYKSTTGSQRRILAMGRLSSSNVNSQYQTSLGTHLTSKPILCSQRELITCTISPKMGKCLGSALTLVKSLTLPLAVGWRPKRDLTNM